MCVRQGSHDEWPRTTTRSRVNLTNVLRSLHEFRGIQPAALLAMKPTELDDFMQDFVAFFQEKGLTGSTVAKYVDSVKSYLAWHGTELKRPLFIEGADDSPNAEAQQIPAPETVRTLLNACDLRTSVIVALEAFSSVRPQVLARSDASDGLRLGDFPELEIAKGNVSFPKTPTPIKVRKALSKTRKAYITFLGPEGCEYVLNYLRSRIARGERLNPDSPLVATEDGNPRFLHRGNLQDCIRVRMRKVGINASTYIHRSYFGNRLVVAESHGVPGIYREFWMGHKGGLQTRYALQKEFPLDVLEDMRRAYAKALPYLETRTQENQADALLESVKFFLVANGWTAAELDKLDLSSKTTEELASLLYAKAAPTPAAPPAPKKPKQRVVKLDELDQALAEGWAFKSELRDGRILVEAET